MTIGESNLYVVNSGIEVDRTVFRQRFAIRLTINRKRETTRVGQNLDRAVFGFLRFRRNTRWLRCKEAESKQSGKGKFKTAVESDSCSHHCLIPPPLRLAGPLLLSCNAGSNQQLRQPVRFQTR